MLNKLEDCSSAKSSNTLDVLSQFAEAISTANFSLIKRLVHSERMAFEIRCNVKVGKSEFLFWLKNLLREFQIENPNKTIPFEFDICNGCQAGSTIIIFDEGRFPIQKPNALFRYTAWNIVVEEGFITEITFCHATEKLRTHDDYAF